MFFSSVGLGVVQDHRYQKYRFLLTADPGVLEVCLSNKHFGAGRAVGQLHASKLRKFWALVLHTTTKRMPRITCRE